MRRNQLLRQLLITRYRLIRPHRLQGEGTIRFASSLRLLIVYNQQCLLDNSIMQDVLQSMHLKAHEVMMITAKQLARVTQKPHYAGWLLGVESQYTFNGICLRTPAFSDFINDTSAKRFFWQQVCTHDNYFFSRR